LARTRRLYARYTKLASTLGPANHGNRDAVHHDSIEWRLVAAGDDWLAQNGAR
jgi:hypothetical protein